MNYLSAVKNSNDYPAKESLTKSIVQNDKLYVFIRGKKILSGSIVWLNPLKLRYAQASMRDKTRDGTHIDKLTKIFLKEGYDKRYPINVIAMQADIADSPGMKLVSFDTRRLKAARKAARMVRDHSFMIAARIWNSQTQAKKAYKNLEHLTFNNNKIPRHIQEQWMDSWEEWHEEPKLENKELSRGSWGHLAKLRMGASKSPTRSKQANNHNGFKKSPFVRKTFATLRPNNRAKKSLFH